MGNVSSEYSAISDIAAHIKIASPLKRGRYLVYALKRYINLTLRKRAYQRKSIKNEQKMATRKVVPIPHRKMMNN